MGKVLIIGIGAGSQDGITYEALNAINSCNVICGYTTYIDLIKDLCQGKKIISTPMRKEVDRCYMALEHGLEENNAVGVICSGDAGVYGMAGLIYQLAQKPEYSNIEIKVIPGVSAAMSGAAVLGAPLMHDFAVISLSDLLTPWELIEKRLNMAAQGDFVICLYNPSSKKRGDYLSKACEIMLKHKSPETVCGWVKNIGRDGEEYGILKLNDMINYCADMFTTIFIGNSSTFEHNGKMITPRGYQVEVV